MNFILKIVISHPFKQYNGFEKLKEKPDDYFCGSIKIQSMKKLFLITTLFGTHQAIGQYYYKDIVSPGQSAGQMLLYKQNGIRNFGLNSFEATGLPSKDLEISTSITKDYSESRTFTSSPAAGKSMLTVKYDEKGRLISSADSTRSFISTNSFEYDAEGKVKIIYNNTNNYDGDFSVEEKHVWVYNGKCPASMTCIKYGTDTTFVKIKCDDKGNPIQEEQYRSGRLLEKVYYYYDEEGRLTDIVRFNSKANKLLPDMMFNYDERGRLSGMITIQDGNLDYQDWQYIYDEQTGLRLKEICYGKRKELLGRVEYEYHK